MQNLMFATQWIDKKVLIQLPFYKFDMSIALAYGIMIYVRFIIWNCQILFDIRLNHAIPFRLVLK